ncbi:ATP-binding protein [Sphingomonas xinjiangensis]|uniref:AAA+ ATPase domain-containing protein n=1 Tax=Sphingomonas xinjiangensis TaxID=643568 RepID=A0A840YH10_9SPHN|nr:ATP-binding protein [Sphingomonas xinjiangensis]MBB5712164.1 hypothetical protein [Sphingomonas xinjiangensis]
MSILVKAASWLTSLFRESKPRVINLPYNPPRDEEDARTERRPLAPDEESSIPASKLSVNNGVDRRTVLQAFDASRPISGRSQLFGRQREIEALLLAVFDYHQHAVVYGARGSGKTSVARVFGDFADQCGAVVLYFPCQPEANFAQLMGALIDGLPPTAIAPQERPIFNSRLQNLPAHFGPSSFVDLVAQAVARPVVLILDEFDRITDDKTKTDIAVAMKLLSDTHAAIRIMLVGIASSVSDILDAHPSLRRHIAVTRIGRIEPTSVKALIANGEAVTGLPFSEEARSIVERVSMGSPYHVRLLCRQAALKAYNRRASEVSSTDVRAGLAEVVELWAATNPADANRFLSVALDPFLQPELEKIAREAAMKDQFAADSSSSNALAMLRDSVVPSAHAEGYWAFADSLAPQFLVAATVLAESDAAQIRHQEGSLDVAAQ